MLEAKDLEMIGEIVTRVMEPMRRDIAEVREDMSEVKQDIAVMKEDIAELQKDMTEVKQDIAVMKEDIAELQKEVSELRFDVTELQKDMTNVKLALENEVKVGINIIAEGHIDLSRKLDMALEISEERKLTELRILRLETEMLRIKEKMQTA